MSDLTYWLSMLLWPAGVLVIALAIFLRDRISGARSHQAKASGTPAE